MLTWEVSTSLAIPNNAKTGIHSTELGLATGHNPIFQGNPGPTIITLAHPERSEYLKEERGRDSHKSFKVRTNPKERTQELLPYLGSMDGNAAAWLLWQQSPMA